MVERSGYWDALLPFSGLEPVQLRDQKNSHNGGVTAGRHMILDNRAARVKNFPATRNPPKKTEDFMELWLVGVTCSCLRTVI